MKYGKNINKFNPGKLHRLNIDRLTISLIPEGSKVLEIGCATGFMGEYLIKEKRCEVYGVEMGGDEAREARKKLTDVIIGDIENKETIKKIKTLGKFDVILASALIEHLKDPWRALTSWKTFLKKNGLLIISTSNIAHWSVRQQILKGNFNYQEYGILDNTHLRFFTTKSFRKLVNDCGYRLEYFGIDPVGGGYPKLSFLGSKLFPNIFAYQMVIKARKYR